MNKQIDYLAPFKYLYIHGPNWLGMWEGLDLADICAGLTNVPAKDWLRNEVVCESLVSRHTYATVLGIGIVGTLLGVHASCYACSLRYALK